MEIGLIVPGFSADEDDWCIPALLDLVRTLSSRHGVRVFTLRYPPFRGHRTVYEARVQAFGGGTASGIRRLPLLSAALSAILAEGRRTRFDVVHGIWADEPGFLATTAGRLLRRPAVVSVAGGELVGLRDIGYGGQLSRVNRWMTRRALHRAARVTVGSRLLARAVADRGTAGVTLVPFGVDITRFAPCRNGPAARSEGPFRLLHVASLSPVKDQATLLRAVGRVVAEHPETVLQIAGDGPLRPSLEALARSLGIAEQTEFLGAVPHDRLPDLMSSAHLCVLSSRHESQNLAVLEAAACGTPFVGTAVGVVPELAPPPLAVPVGDAGALASAILLMMADDERRGRLAEAQQRTVRHRFALERTVETLTSVYRAVM